MNKKHHNEPFYKGLSLEQALASGFFVPGHDKIDWKRHVDLPCTPVNFLKTVTADEKPAVLIATGALCPMHEGHYEMMRQARIAVETRGYKVIGGYLSPGHDQYIKDKTGDNWMPIHDRIRWINNRLEQCDWLAVDPWEGIFAPGSVNFTSVVYRLQYYLKKFYKHAENVKIFFVCGGDNARFIIPFKDTDIGTIVCMRPKYDEIVKQYKIYESENVLFVDSFMDISSTEVRRTDEYKNFNKQKQKQLCLRMNWNYMEMYVLDVMQQHFSVVWPKSINAQMCDYRSVVKHGNVVVNLDPEITEGRRLEISRLFDNFGQKKLGFTHRPGSTSVRKQIYKLLTEDYFNECYLFDDDIATGSTMNYVEEQFNKFGIKVLGRMSFVSGNSEDMEILDAKDFLIAYCSGGLVTKMFEKLVRVPYVYPFVDPSTRASINDPLRFSIAVWEMNMSIWKDKDTTIQSCPDYHYLLKLGHKRDDTMYEVSKYYHDFLKELIRYA